MTTRAIILEDFDRDTLREIAEELAGLGFRSATGKPIAPSVVARMVKG